MGIYKTEVKNIVSGGHTIEIIPKENFDSFSEHILGLGDVSRKSKVTYAISVIFDLEGFTDFCKQIDSQLVVPEFLSEFLKWIFKEVKEELIVQPLPTGYRTWAPLPFFSKFLGDGLLFLWDTDGLSETEIMNIVVTMYEICKKYVAEFYPKLDSEIVDIPNKLRCGIARGAIYSVGDGNDFVGPCINMSARLQKVSALSFCFSRRGMKLSDAGDEYQEVFFDKKVKIRGIGENEIVYILKDEYEKLNPLEKEKFK